MNTKLNSVQNWPELARQAKWSVAALAKLCGVSKDGLRRHFHEQTGKSPKTWLSEQRQHQAIELLRDGSSIKEIAACLGYKQQTNFTRKFKEFWGTCPSRQPPANLVPPKMREND
jgi:AraC-like DNA-binding protein